MALTESERSLALQWKDKIGVWKNAASAESVPSSNKTTTVVSALDLYELGKVLARLATHGPEANQGKTKLQSAVVALIVALPKETAVDLFDDLHGALLALLAKNQEEATAKREDCREGLVSVKALYHAMIAGVSTSWNKQKETATPVSTSIHSILEASLDEEEHGFLQQLVPFLRSPGGTSDTTAGLLSTCSTTHVQELVAMLVFETALYTNSLPWERFLPALHLLQQEQEVWQDLMEIQNDRHAGWQRQLAHERYPEHAIYLESLLTVSSRDDDAPVSLLRPEPVQDAKPTPVVVVSAQDAIQQRIAQVQAVLPDFGQGFLEVALALFHGNVQQTTAALLDAPETWPGALSVMDRALPRRKQATASAAALEEEEEARQVTKRAALAAENKAEQEARAMQIVLRDGAHDEYNDDYDDQYDDMQANGDIGGADQGLSSYDSVRTYNRLVKQVEQDDQFWQENRNDNHAQKLKKEKNFGPDKMRGGRVPNAGGRGRGGGGRGRGRGEAAARGGGGKGQGTAPAATSSTQESAAAAEGVSEESKKRTNQRAKNRKLSNRRDQQKKAAVKKTG